MIAAYLICVGLGSVHPSAPLTVPQVFAELRLSPEHLVAAGVPPESLAGMVGEITESASILDAVVALQTALTAVTDTIESLTASNPDDPQVIAALAAANASGQTLQAEVAAAWESLYAAAAVGLDAPVRERLARLRNSSLSPIPTHFRVVQLDPGVERTLAIALRQEQRMLTGGGDLDEAWASALATIRSNAEVAAATNRLESGLAAMEIAMAQAGAAAAEE